MDGITYEQVLAFSQSWGSVYFMVLFRGCVRIRAVAVEQEGLQRRRQHST